METMPWDRSDLREETNKSEIGNGEEKRKIGGAVLRCATVCSFTPSPVLFFVSLALSLYFSTMQREKKMEEAER